MIKRAFLPLLALPLLLAMAFRIHMLHQQIQALPNLPQPEDTEDAVLFDRLLKAGLITQLPDGRLQLKPSDFILVQRAEHAQNPGLPPIEPITLKDQERLNKLKSNINLSTLDLDNTSAHVGF